MSDANDFKILNRRLAGQLIALQQITHELTRIRDTIIEPVRPGGDRGEDRQAYAATLIEFGAWCDRHEVSLPLTLKRLAEIVMRERVVELTGSTLDAVIDAMLAAEPGVAGDPPGDVPGDAAGGYAAGLN